jgi:glycosyltransferase involved in cell wall biosynthesis
VPHAGKYRVQLISAAIEGTPHPSARSGRLNVCLASRALAPGTHSGVARATADLAAQLAGRGHGVHVITRSPDAPAVGIPGVEVEAIATPAPGGAAVLDHLAHAVAVHRAVADLHERRHVDAVVTPLWGCEGVVCLLDPRFPTVVSCMTSMTTIEGLRPRTAPTEEAGQLIALERATIRRARFLHGLTRSALDKTIADYDAAPDDAAVVPRGVVDRAGAAGAGAGSEAPRILFVGRLEFRKGVDVLLEAARGLAGDGVSFSLVLVGPDSTDTETGAPYRAAFERDSAAGGALARSVRFAGAVGDDELNELYRGADVVCVPSRYESHGIVLVEAMMFGKPVVACDAGGVPEVVENGSNALLAMPGDPVSLAAALRRLLDDRELRRRFGARSRAIYEERFDADVVATAMEGFLGRVGAAHARAPAAARDLPDELAGVVEEVLGWDRDTARRTAAELLDPPAAGWRGLALDAEREHAAWQARAVEAERQVGEWRARALEAERQRAESESALAGVAGSRWWRATRPLRRFTYALRRR